LNRVVFSDISPTAYLLNAVSHRRVQMCNDSYCCNNTTIFADCRWLSAVTNHNSREWMHSTRFPSVARSSADSLTSCIAFVVRSSIRVLHLCIVSKRPNPIFYYSEVKHLGKTPTISDQWRYITYELGMGYCENWKAITFIS